MTKRMSPYSGNGTSDCYISRQALPPLSDLYRGSSGAITMSRRFIYLFILFAVTVKLQWLEHLWNHENMFETEAGRANEC